MTPTKSASAKKVASTKVALKKVKATVFSSEGKKLSEIDLDPAVFGIDAKARLIHKAVMVQRANARAVLAHTKTRGERRGGGRKPWKQKGTGRARHGSIRSPQWKKGGVVFGPRKDRNFELKMNRKERRQAILGALSLLAARPDGVLVLEDLKLTEIKTKRLASLFKKLPVKRSALLVIGSHDKNIESSARNLATVKTQLADNLNVMDLMRYRHLVLPKEVLTQVGKIYLSK